MKINGLEYNFGRCLRFTFTDSAGNVKMVVEHAPDVDRDLYICMEAEITDMPSSRANDKPGFQAKIKILNPANELLDVIAQGATWLCDYRDDLTESMDYRRVMRDNTMQRYYKSRLQINIDAGYTVGYGDGQKKANYTNVFHGWVFGSSYSHQGTDDVLTIGAFDIDVTEQNVNLQQEYTIEELWSATLDKAAAQSRFVDLDKNELEPTFLESFKKFIRNYETKRLQTGSDKNMSYGSTLIDVSSADRQTDSWYNIYVVSTESAWWDMIFQGKSVGYDTLNPQLAARLKYEQMQHGGVTGKNLDAVLDNLCRLSQTDIGWRRIVTGVSKNSYLIFPMGNTRKIVQGSKADIQIWNYQNLLESPSIDGAGKMQIKMLFNPKCICLATIALMLDSTIGETDVTRDVASFEGGTTYGSVNANTVNAFAGVNQITGNNNVASLRKSIADKKEKGYLFNLGLPIIKVQHILSTYRNDWTTIVNTVPTITGFNNKAKK